MLSWLPRRSNTFYACSLACRPHHEVSWKEAVSKRVSPDWIWLIHCSIKHSGKTAVLAGEEIQSSLVCGLFLATPGHVRVRDGGGFCFCIPAAGLGRIHVQERAGMDKYKQSSDCGMKGA